MPSPPAPIAAAGKAAELVMTLARQRDILHALKIDAPPRIYQLKPPWSPDGTDPAA